MPKFLIKTWIEPAEKYYAVEAKDHIEAEEKAHKAFRRELKENHNVFAQVVPEIK